jgi:hypothetical protein
MIQIPSLISFALFELAVISHISYTGPSYKNELFKISANSLSLEVNIFE